jgi:hypothetical protein
MSLFITSLLCGVGDSYSQLYNPHGVKILSPTRAQEVSVNLQNLTVEGVSTDNSTNDCEVSILLNGVTPYAAVTAKGQNGTEDFSVWERIFNSNFRLKVGENQITAKLLCSNDDSSQISKYHSVNFTGINDSISSSPRAEELTSRTVRENSSLISSYDAIENKSTIPRSDHKSKESSNEQVDGNITSGPVIIPPQERQSPSSSPSPIEETIIANLTNMSSADNLTSGPVIIPPQERQSPSSSPSPIEETIIANSTNMSSADNLTSGTVTIPPQEGQSPSSSPSASLGSQRSPPLDHVPKEIDQSQETSSMTTGDIPLIFPTPSPRVTTDVSQDKPSLSAPVEVSSPIIRVENNNSKIGEGSAALLNATQSYSTSGPIVSHTWKPLTSHSIQILGEPNSPILKFKAPAVSQDTPLQFELMISDSNGRSETGIAQVLVQDIEGLDLGTSNESNVQIPSISESAVQEIPSNVRIPSQSDAELSGFLSEPNTTLKSSENLTSGTIVRNSPEGEIETAQDYPRAMAGVDQIVNEGMGVILQGDSSTANETQELAYEWAQIDGDIKVEFGGHDSKEISFQAPEVNADSVLTFRFIASTEGGPFSSDKVNVIINDLPELPEDEEPDNPQDEENSNNDDEDDDN